MGLIKELQTDYEIVKRDKKIKDLTNRINDAVLYMNCCNIFYDTKLIVKILKGKYKLKKQFLKEGK